MSYRVKFTIAIIMASIALFIMLYLRQLNVWWFDVLVMFFLIEAVIELDLAFRKSSLTTIRPMLIIAVLLILPAYYLLGLQGSMLALLISFMIGSAIFTFNHKYNYKDLLATAFIIIYPMMFMLIFIEINHKTGGLFGVFLIILTAVLSDTFAQWVGTIFKGKKLCPSISPNKTVAGAIGAYIGGLVSVAIIFIIFEYFQLFANMRNVYFTGLTGSMWRTVPLYVALGVIGSTTAIIGDLFASWMKRQFKIKDYGSLLPGHGGIMDRADSIMYTAPFMYLVFLFIPSLAQV